MHLIAASFLAIAVSVTAAKAGDRFSVTGTQGSAVQAEVITTFDQPWAMTFLPDGTMLVTTKPGKLFYVSQDGRKTEVGEMWPVAFGGQGGLGDVVAHPRFAENGLLYISYAQTRDSGSTYGAVVARARLDRSGDRPRLADAKVVWRQSPTVAGRAHYGHRIAFAPDGMLFITSGDRRNARRAQDFTFGLGKVIRLNEDGTVPADNPWQDKGDLARTFWSMGHRNPLGIAFDDRGRLWVHEMGPRGGDELNLIVKGDNYGWPVVSNGDNYSGIPIPDHDTRPEFNPPEAYWVPSISPAGFVIYDGRLFSKWRGNGLMGGLSSRALVRVAIEGDSAREAERFEWGKRVREVEQGPDGALWVLEDRSGGRLLKLTPG